MAKETAYYRIDGVPQKVADLFDKATRRVSQAAQTRGEGHVSQTAALVALLRSEDLLTALEEGQARAASRPPKEKKVDRGYHVPVSVKDRLREIADAQGIKVGAVGRLILIASADHLAELIEKGITASRAEDASAARQQQLQVPA